VRSSEVKVGSRTTVAISGTCTWMPAQAREKVKYTTYHAEGGKGDNSNGLDELHCGSC
jgi:hypothetical protein